MPRTQARIPKSLEMDDLSTSFEKCTLPDCEAEGSHGQFLGAGLPISKTVASLPAGYAFIDLLLHIKFIDNLSAARLGQSLQDAGLAENLTYLDAHNFADPAFDAFLTILPVLQG